MAQVFNDEWKIWIWTNVASGQDKAALFNIMLDAGFAYEDIVNELGLDPQTLENENTALSPDASGAADAGEFAQEMRRIILPHAQKIDSEKIDLYVVEDFLEPSECEELIEAIKLDLIPSTVVQQEEEWAISNERTSKSCNFTAHDTPLARDVDLRMSNYLGINWSFTEFVQGQFYEQGEAFGPHHVYFPTGKLDSDVVGARGQRTMSAMIFLNDVTKGGALRFPDIDLAIEAKAGRMVLWNNMDINGNPNPLTLHQGEQVQQGTKAIVTKFFRRNGSGSMINTDLLSRGPAYTPQGFSKTRIPEGLFQRLQRFNNENENNFKEEVVEGYISGQGNSGSQLLDIPQNLREEIHSQLQPLLEEWSGSRLLPTFVYGIRRYLRGAQLKIHRDQESTHIISAVLNITQDVDEDWHLHIDDHFFRRHKVTLLPGEMLVYEGQNLAHGRPEPLNGRCYNNVFVHYKPGAAG